MLLFLHGYEVELKALRRSLETGLDHLEEFVARHAAGASDPDEIARRVAEGIVAEPPSRKKEERTYRRRQIKQARGEEQLIRAYTALAHPLIGGRLHVGSFFGAYRSLGQDFRSALPAGPPDFPTLERSIDEQLAELSEHGGFATILRASLPDLTLESLVGLREFSRGAFRFVAALGFSLEVPSSFLADLYAALLNPDRPSEPGSAEQDSRASTETGTFDEAST